MWEEFAIAILVFVERFYEQRNIKVTWFSLIHHPLLWNEMKKRSIVHYLFTDSPRNTWRNTEQQDTSVKLSQDIESTGAWLRKRQVHTSPDQVHGHGNWCVCFYSVTAILLERSFYLALSRRFPWTKHHWFKCPLSSFCQQINV